MALQFYDRERLSSGFHGWRVVATIRGKRYQKYFSARRPSESIPVDLWLRYQETKAKLYEARMMARSAAIQYIDFISTDHPRTKPYRGLGMHGITLGIGTGNRCITEQCYFQVNIQGQPIRVTVTEERGITQSWCTAVDIWGEAFGIRLKDIERKKGEVPSPDKFRDLRRYLNDHDRRHLPVSVLHNVYAESREDLELLRSKLTLRDRVEGKELLGFHAHMEREIQYFLHST